MKLGDDSLERFRASGLGAAAAVPAVPSILPLPLMEGPGRPGRARRGDPRRHPPPRAVRAGVRALPDRPRRRPRDDRSRASARSPRRGARRACRSRSSRSSASSREYWTVVSSLDEAAALIDEAGADVGLLYDSWHLWREPLEQIERHRERIRGVHLADWREPTRNTNDRVLPGDGVVDFAPILEALRWDGFYDLEIFSDAGAARARSGGRTRASSPRAGSRR